MKPNETIDKLWRQAQENVQLLESCQLHRFDFINYTTPLSVSKVRCLHCKGRVSTSYAFAYIKGYVAAGKPESDVVANHRESLFKKGSQS